MEEFVVSIKGALNYSSKLITLVIMVPHLKADPLFFALKYQTCRLNSIAYQLHGCFILGPLILFVQSIHLH